MMLTRACKLTSCTVSRRLFILNSALRSKYTKPDDILRENCLHKPLRMGPKYSPECTTNQPSGDCNSHLTETNQSSEKDLTQHTKDDLFLSKARKLLYPVSADYPTIEEVIEYEDHFTRRALDNFKYVAITAVACAIGLVVVNFAIRFMDVSKDDD